MHRILVTNAFHHDWLLPSILLALIASPATVVAGPYVEFDFTRTAECRDVTPAERIALYPHQRLAELTLPVSVRFRGVPPDDVEEITIEISGAEAGLLVQSFAPATQLATDIPQPIETTSTSKSGYQIDGTLGGALPVPFATKVANVAPSISAGTSSGETVTEKLSRLPRKHALVVSGTSLEGRAVFFKIKPSSQTSLEGVHELAVTFIVPAGWRGADVRVACSARGRKKVLFITQSATLGRQGDAVRLFFVAPPSVRHVAKPVTPDTEREIRPVSFLEAATAGVAELVEKPAESKDDAANEPPSIAAKKSE